MNPIFMDPWESLPGSFQDLGYANKDNDRRDYPGWPPIRKNMGYTRKYAERTNLNKMFPHGELSTSSYCLANPGEEYLVYLPEGGAVGMNLGPSKRLFNVEWFNPATGEAIAGKPAESLPYLSYNPESRNEFTAPFSSDAVLYLYALK
jgi:hypothetical protein